MFHNTNVLLLNCIRFNAHHLYDTVCKECKYRDRQTDRQTDVEVDTIAQRKILSLNLIIRAFRT